MDRITVIRQIVEQKQCQKVDGVLLDLTSAGAIMAVYNNLSAENQVKYAAMQVDTMARLAWKLLK